MKARGQITIHNVRDGETAEFYRLKVVREEAIVKADGVLKGTFSYSIEYVKGSVTTIKNGNRNELYVTCRTNTNVNVPITLGAINSGNFTLNEYVKAANRPDYFIVELKKGNDVLETRNIQVMMEAASYTKIVNDMRETVSTNGKDITSIKQDAQSIRIIAEGLRTGVRNLLTGGKVGKTYHTYGYSEGSTNIKLKPNTTYTMTVSGHISVEAVAKGQTLHAYIIADGWAWSAGGANLEINSVSDTIKHYTFTTPATLPNDGICTFDAYPTPNKMPHEANGDVTVNWAVVTEGTAPASDWIPPKEESADERIKSVELKLENGEFRIKSDETVFVDNSGNETVLIQGGKLTANLIDSKKIVTDGLQAGDIDAGNAKVKNLTVEGDSVFNGTIKTEDGTIAGWTIKHGMIGYGVEYNGLTLLDTCLIYNYKNKNRQVIVGEDPLSKISYGADTMLALRNDTHTSVRNIGLLVDVAPSKDFFYRDNFAIFAIRGTYAGFRRNLEVVNNDYTLKKEDSSILFTNRDQKVFTLPSDPEEGEEFTIYSVFGASIDFNTNDGTTVDGSAIAPEDKNHFSLRCTYRIVFSMVHKTWFVFVQ